MPLWQIRSQSNLSLWSCTDNIYPHHHDHHTDSLKNQVKLSQNDLGCQSEICSNYRFESECCLFAAFSLDICERLLRNTREIIQTAVKLFKGFAHFLENFRELQIQAKWKTSLSKHLEFLELEYQTLFRMFQVKCVNIITKTPTKQLPLWNRKATIFQINNTKYIQKCLYLTPGFCPLPSKGQLLCHAVLGLTPGFSPVSQALVTPNICCTYRTPADEMVRFRVFHQRPEFC